MQITRENLNPCTIKLEIACEAGEVNEGFESAFRHLTKKVRLPGFRPGKAPRSMLEPFIAESEWNDQAAEEMVRKVYPKALEEEKLEVDRTTLPHVTINQINRNEKKFEFSVKVPLPPKVELGDYKGLAVIQPEAQVSEEEIDYELQELRRRGSSHAPVTDRGVADGDVAVLNIKPEDKLDQERTIVIVAGDNFPQLDEAITGMRVEELKNVELSFPGDFQQKEWAGKTFKAQVTVNSISGVALPNLDDQFAQSLNTESVEQLRNRLREVIGQAKQQMVRQVVHERLVDELMQRSEVAVSDNMWENLANRRLNELAQEQSEKGKSLEQYATENGMSLEEFTQAWKDKAKLEVERALLVQAVYAKEDMEVDNQGLNQELLAMAGEYQLEPVELLDLLKKNNSIEELHFRALTRKVGDFLLSNAAVSIGDQPSAEAAEETQESKPAPKPRKRASAKKETEEGKG